MQLPDYFQFKDLILALIADSEIKETVQVINKAYAYQEKVKGEPRTNTSHLKRKIKEAQFYVVKKKTRIVGCVYLEPNGTSLHFGLLTVDDAHRGSGLAKAMLTAIEDYAIAKGYSTLGLAYMSVAPWLKKYYGKYGFAETAEVTEWGVY